MDCSPPGALSKGFPRQEYWSGWPFPSPGDLPDPGIEPVPPTSQADALPSETPGKQFVTLKSLSHQNFEFSLMFNYCTSFPCKLGFPVVQLVKNLPAVWETWVQSLDWEDPLDSPLQYSCLENPH